MVCVILACRRLRQENSQPRLQNVFKVRLGYVRLCANCTHTDTHTKGEKVYSKWHCVQCGLLPVLKSTGTCLVVTTFENLVQNENINKPIDILYTDVTLHNPVCLIKCIIKINCLPGLAVHTYHLRRVRQEDHDSEANLSYIAGLAWT